MAAINTVLTVPKVNPCLYCNRSYIHRRDLLKHLNKTHPEKVAEEGWNVNSVIKRSKGETI